MRKAGSLVPRVVSGRKECEDMIQCLVDVHPRNQSADGSNILCRFALGARSIYVQQRLDLIAIRGSSTGFAASLDSLRLTKHI